MDGSDLPLVCICIPTYNAAPTIRETIRSLLEQSYANIVVNVVDNASTDETVQIVKSLSSPRVLIHQNPNNIGAEGNFNRCIELASGKYTAIFHADDLYGPDMVASQVAFLECYGCVGAVFTEAHVIDEEGRLSGRIGAPHALDINRPYYEFAEIFKALLLHSNFLICPSAMARTSVYKDEIKEWRGDLFGSAADLDVWLRIARKHHIGVIRKPLMQYRVWKAQWSAKIRMNTERAMLFNIIDHYLEDPSVHAILNAQDWTNYRRLERRDRIMRAVNLFLQGATKEAQDLCYDTFSWDALGSAAQSQRGFFVLILGCYMKLLFLAGAGSFGRASLMYLKKKTKT